MICKKMFCRGVVTVFGKNEINRSCTILLGMVILLLSGCARSDNNSSIRGDLREPLRQYTTKPVLGGIPAKTLFKDDGTPIWGIPALRIMLKEGMDYEEIGGEFFHAHIFKNPDRTGVLLIYIGNSPHGYGDYEIEIKNAVREEIEGYAWDTIKTENGYFSQTLISDFFNGIAKHYGIVMYVLVDAKDMKSLDQLRKSAKTIKIKDNR